MADISAGWRHRTTQAAAFGLLSSVAVALLGLLLLAGPVGAEAASSAGGAPVGLGTPAAGDAGDTKGVHVGTEAQAPSPGHAAPATPIPGGHRFGDPASTTITGPPDGEVQDKAPDLRPLDSYAVAQLEVDGRRGATPAGDAGPGPGQTSGGVRPREYLSAGGGQTIAAVGPAHGGGEGPATAATPRGTTTARPPGGVVGAGRLRAGLLPGDDRPASGIEALQGRRGSGDGAEAGRVGQANQAGAPDGGLASISVTDQAPPPRVDASTSARADRHSTGGDVADLTDGARASRRAVAGAAGPARTSGTEEMSSATASAAPSHPGSRAWQLAGISTGATTGPTAGVNGAEEMARAPAGGGTGGAYTIAGLPVVGSWRRLRRLADGCPPAAAPASSAPTSCWARWPVPVLRRVRS